MLVVLDFFKKIQVFWWLVVDISGALRDGLVSRRFVLFLQKSRVYEFKLNSFDKNDKFLNAFLQRPFKILHTFAAAFEAGPSGCPLNGRIVEKKIRFVKHSKLFLL